MNAPSRHISTRLEWTEGPWEFVPGTEHHGPYVAGPYGGDICDCYVMSNPSALSVRNGGTSVPIWHQPDHAQANARLIAAAPDLYDALHSLAELYEGLDSPSFLRARAALAKARGE